MNSSSLCVCIILLLSNVIDLHFSKQTDLLQRSLSCPSGWTLINSRSEVISNNIRNCLSMGTNLASVQDLNEYNQIQIIVTAAGHGAKQAWIGGTNAQEVLLPVHFISRVVGLGQLW
uniref:C-type lectin domain-containing protein n=1 Tax=Xiphophorus couchianus TaxID=32473 RepID=A0A3B5LWH5_9TELE